MGNASSFCPPKGEYQCDYREVEKREMKPTGYKNYKSTYNQLQNNSSVRITVRIRWHAVACFRFADKDLEIFLRARHHLKA